MEPRLSQLDRLREGRTELENHHIDELVAGRLDRRQFIRRASVLGMSASLTGAILAACGGANKTGGTTTGGGSPAGTATAKATSSAKPTSGGTLKLAMLGPGASPNPLTSDDTAIIMFTQAGEYLVFDSNLHLQLQPMLATSWTHNSDGTVWTFKLRKGVKFHDGSPFSSSDVAYTMKRILQPATAAAGLASITGYVTADGIDTPDATTVRFRLAGPNAFLPVLLSSIVFAIVKNGETDFSTGNGTGPFTMTAFNPLSSLSLRRHSGYWQSGLPYLDGVNYVVIADDPTRIEALTSGSQDWIDNITGSEIQLLSTGTTEAQFLKAGGWFGLTMFGDTAPFNNPQVIQAMKLAANRKTIADAVAPGIDLLTPDIPIPPSDPYYPKGMKVPHYDPEKAKSLLASAGYSSGLDIDIYAYQGDKLDTVVAYKSTAQAAGINVNIQNVPHDTFFSADFLKKPAIGISVARLHIAQTMTREYLAGGSLNLVHFNDDRVTNLIKQGLGTVNESKAKQLFGEALTIVNDNAAHVIPGWEGQVYGKSKNVTGIELSNGGTVYLANASVGGSSSS